MALFMDPPMPSPRTVGPAFREGQLFAHLTADTEQELRAYMGAVGRPLVWIQKSGTPHFHTDVTGRFLRRAQGDARVLKLSWKDFVRRMREGGRLANVRSVRNQRQA